MRKRLGRALEVNATTSMRYRSLDEVLDDLDDGGLLAARIGARTPDRQERMRDAFEIINRFFDEQNREPSEVGEREERILAKRLEEIRCDPDRIRGLLDCDRHGLLKIRFIRRTETASTGLFDVDPDADLTETLEDVWSDDDAGLLNAGDVSLFQPRTYATLEERETDIIAQRRPCEDFARFEPLFERINRRMHEGVAKTRRFRFPSSIEVGDYFIAYGLLCLVDCVLDPRENLNANDPRLRVVFSNGTEINLLRKSLAKALAYKKGRRILDPEIDWNREHGISHHDRRSGIIYILRSLNRRPELREYQHLVKIGYTEGTLDERIRDAEQDPTFLEAPVEVAESFTCYNLDPRKFEQLVHGFLASRRLHLEIRGRNGKLVRPREWFAISPESAVQVVKSVVEGTIHQYRLDGVSGRVVKK